MATKIKFPYTMHCPKCKAPLKIKSANLVGTRIACPKCQKKIDIVTPDEDAYVAYGVESAPEPEPEPEPTEEEIEARLKEKKKKKQIEILRQIWFWLGVLFLMGLVGVGGYIVYTYAIVPFAEEDLSVPTEGKGSGLKEFQ
jgi:DNA-directed RNA polymerase subunit M/transcription elongation factor TFIIS